MSAATGDIRCTAAVLGFTGLSGSQADILPAQVSSNGRAKKYRRSVVGFVFMVIWIIVGFCDTVESGDPPKPETFIERAVNQLPPVGEHARVHPPGAGAKSNEMEQWRAAERLC